MCAVTHLRFHIHNPTATLSPCRSYRTSMCASLGGATPLILSAKAGRSEFVRWLLELSQASGRLFACHGCSRDWVVQASPV